MRARSIATLLFFVGWLSIGIGSAAPVAVRYKEGLTHGFLVLSTLDGKPIAEGDLTEVVHGQRVSSRLLYRFKDGSRQEETLIFSQSRYFRLISYHLVQKGPTFERPTELTVNCKTGQVTVQSSDKDGKEKVATEHMKLPPDLANGLVLTLTKNLGPESPPVEVSMIVATPKPRLVKLAIHSQAKDPYSIAGSRREALHYVIKVEIGGIAGALAPLLGKQPPDGHVWITSDEAPTFVKSESISFLGGPVWRTELISPVWPKAAEEKDGGAAKH